MIELKSNIGNLLTDCLDSQEQIDELKHDIGDS
jgi:hypothetical protein